MNSISLLSSRTTRQTISSLTPYSIGMPLYRFKPTVEMYFRGSMVEGQMKLRKPTKSTLSLYPYSPNRILTSSSDLAMRFSSSICRTCLLVINPSPLEMQLKSASGWKSDRVVMASLQAWRTFSCCSSSAKQVQMWLKISPYFSQARLATLYRFITNILQSYSGGEGGKGMQRRVIIINADDFGCKESIDRGIARLMRQGCINSASVIVNAEHIEQAAKMVRQMRDELDWFDRGVSIGLHFNITEGKPLTSQILSSKLVENGEFVGKPKIFTIVSEPGSFQPRHISLELTAQIERFIELFGRKPSHIDGHNHVHIVPPFAEAIAETMRQLGIYKTRIPLQKLQAITIPLNHTFLQYAAASREIYRKNGIFSVKEFVGLQNFGRLSPQLLKKAILRQEGSEGVSVEMMCHPGFPTEEGTAWVRSQDRLAEMQQLENEFGQFRRNGNYYELCDEPNKGVRLVICATMKEQKKGGFKEQEKMLEKRGVDVYYWTKIQQRISQRINSLDFELFLKSLKPSHIIDLFPEPSQAYLGQAAQCCHIPFLPINEPGQIIKKIAPFLPSSPPSQEGNKNQ